MTVDVRFAAEVWRTRWLDCSGRPRSAPQMRSRREGSLADTVGRRAVQPRYSALPKGEWPQLAIESDRRRVNSEAISSGDAVSKATWACLGRRSGCRLVEAWDCRAAWGCHSLDGSSVRTSPQQKSAKIRKLLRVARVLPGITWLLPGWRRRRAGGVGDRPRSRRARRRQWWAPRHRYNGTPSTRRCLCLGDLATLRVDPRRFQSRSRQIPSRSVPTNPRLPVAEPAFRRSAATAGAIGYPVSAPALPQLQAWSRYQLAGRGLQSPFRPALSTYDPSVPETRLARSPIRLAHARQSRAP